MKTPTIIQSKDSKTNVKICPQLKYAHLVTKVCKNPHWSYDSQCEPNVCTSIMYTGATDFTEYNTFRLVLGAWGFSVCTAGIIRNPMACVQWTWSAPVGQESSSERFSEDTSSCPIPPCSSNPGFLKLSYIKISFLIFVYKHVKAFKCIYFFLQSLSFHKEFSKFDTILHFSQDTGRRYRITWLFK